MRRTGEEDEDEDVDFNPFLKETLSPETSLSLGSEIDGLDGEVDSWGKTFDNSLGVNLLKPTSEVQNSAVGDSVSRTPKKRKSCSNSQPKADTVQTKDNVSEIDYIDVLVGDLSNTAQSQKPVIDLENEDAVCTRTRGCYSLASFTLDELKTLVEMVMVSQIKRMKLLMMKMNIMMRILRQKFKSCLRVMLMKVLEIKPKRSMGELDGGQRLGRTGANKTLPNIKRSSQDRRRGH